MCACVLLVSAKSSKFASPLARARAPYIIIILPTSTLPAIVDSPVDFHTKNKHHPPAPCATQILCTLCWPMFVRVRASVRACFRWRYPRVRVRVPSYAHTQRRKRLFYDQSAINLKLYQLIQMRTLPKRKVSRATRRRARVCSLVLAAHQHTHTHTHSCCGRPTSTTRRAN